MSMLLGIPPAHGQEGDRAASDARRQMKQIEQEAKNLPWDQEAGVISDAHRNIFQRNGWNSESDQFALNLVNEISRIPPWNTAEREALFMDRIQVRYSLTQPQRELTQNEFRREMMGLTLRHMRDLMPMALEVTRMRISRQPYTAEQVQKWSRRIEPIMGDALAAVERIKGSMEAGMSDEQKALLNRDMEAVVRRHRDVEKMVQKWKRGEWTPLDWGLEHDPVHVNAVHAVLQKQTADAELVALEELAKQPDLHATARDQSTWEKYVTWFCNYYKCDNRQRGVARGILDRATAEATQYVVSRGRDLLDAEQRVASAGSADARAAAQKRVDGLREPLVKTFERMCRELEATVLTSKQRRFLDSQRAQAAKREAARTTTAPAAN